MGVLSKKDIIKLTLPLLAEYALTISMGFITSLMVSFIGTAAISAVGYINTAAELVVTLFMAIGTGAAVVIAQCIGAGNVQKAKKTCEQATLSGMIFGAGLSLVLLVLCKPIISLLLGAAEPQVFEYGFTYFVLSVLSFPFQSVISVTSGILRGSGNTKKGMYIAVFVSLINVSLGAILIYGAKLGVLGAGIAILVARILGAGLAFFILRKSDPRIRLDRIPRRFDYQIQKSLMHIGLPVGVEALVFQSGRFLTQTFIVAMGTAQLAANSLVNSMMSMVLIPATAVCYAATTVIGMDVGSGNRDQAKTDLRFMLRLGIYSASVVCLFSALFLPQIIGMFRPDPDVFLITQQCMYWIIGGAFFLWPLGFITPYGLKGAGDVIYTTIVALLSMFFFRVALGYLLGVVMGLQTLGVVIAMIADWVVRAIFFYGRIYGKKWLSFKAQTE